jgi:hypothetical protein
MIATKKQKSKIKPTTNDGDHIRNNWIMHRFEGLGHKFIVRVWEDLWQPEGGASRWQIEALFDGSVAAQGSAATDREARKFADRFFKGHMVNQIAGWAEESMERWAEWDKQAAEKQRMIAESQKAGNQKAGGQ